MRIKQLIVIIIILVSCNKKSSIKNVIFYNEENNFFFEIKDTVAYFKNVEYFYEISEDTISLKSKFYTKFDKNFYYKKDKKRLLLYNLDSFSAEKDSLFFSPANENISFMEIGNYCSYLYLKRDKMFHKGIWFDKKSNYIYAFNNDVCFKIELDFPIKESVARFDSYSYGKNVILQSQFDCVFINIKQLSDSIILVNTDSTSLGIPDTLYNIHGFDINKYNSNDVIYRTDLVEAQLAVE